MTEGILRDPVRVGEDWREDTMEIAGLGTQIVDCARVRTLIEKHDETFLTQVYSEREVLFCRDRTQATEHYAAVWAAKEAVFRALGTTWRKGVPWTEVEIYCDNPIEPVVIVTGSTREIYDANGIKMIHLSMAHSREFATATAIAVR